MLIKSVKLNNYRNYSSSTINFTDKLNIIIGKNGIGKTNILESLIVVSNTKSFRTLNDSDLIQKDKEYSRIEVDSDEGLYKVVINNDNKSLFINNNHIKKTSEFIGKINCVLFKPSDLELFDGSPKERRKLLDIEIGKVSNLYLNSILKYNSILKDKNHLLKENNINSKLLDVFDEMMFDEIRNIILEREKFFEIINKYITNYYQNISGSNSKIEVIYKNCSDIENIKDNLLKNRERDIYYHYAVFGPHHEDYEFKIDDYSLNSVASQGQRRMVFIAFKFALIEYIKQYTNKTPIILLDDVLSELDKDNQERLLTLLPSNGQVIITNTDLKGLNINSDYKLIELKEGICQTQK